MNWASCCLFFLWVLFVRVDGGTRAGVRVDLRLAGMVDWD
uniref:Uncharacterized protein n=1 Tax=Triticum urartu TaxID=4572 RepID=A0A8R7R7I5_TRIUA